MAICSLPSSSSSSLIASSSIASSSRFSGKPLVQILGKPMIQALDNFNTAVVSPIYYALFTAFTILASAIMFKDYSGQSIGSIVSELCGFVTILSGTFLLHSTREPDPPVNTGEEQKFEEQKFEGEK